MRRAEPENWPSMDSARDVRADSQLVDFFVASGVPDSQIVRLCDRDATARRIEVCLRPDPGVAVSHIISHVPLFILRFQAEFERCASSAAPDSTLFIYLAGHGHFDAARNVHAFVPYDAHRNTNLDDCVNLVSFAGLLRRAQSDFRGRSCIVAADCCFSGGLAAIAERMQVEGAVQHLPVILESDVDYSSTLDGTGDRSVGFRFALACLCSAYQHNSSTGDWTFTQSLLEALQGMPHTDLADDGTVSLADAANCACHHMFPSLFGNYCQNLLNFTLPITCTCRHRVGNGIF